MNLFQKPIDSAIQLAKTASKTVILEKNNRLFLRNNQLFIPANNKQTEFKEIELERLYTVVYTGSLQSRATSSFLRTLRKSTKQPHLDHLHNNQENDLENLKKDTLLGQH